MSDVLGLFLQYSKTSIKGEMQYKLDFSIASVAVFLREATGIFVIYLTLLKFNNINGWNLNEMLFLFSLLFLTYGIFIYILDYYTDWSKITLITPLDKEENINFHTKRCGFIVDGEDIDGNIRVEHFLMKR